MRREIKNLIVTDDCCPGHDAYPDGVYGSKQSRKARSKGKKKEHKYVRTVVNRRLKREVESYD